MLRVGARGNTRAAETAGPLTPEFPNSRARAGAAATCVLPLDVGGRAGADVGPAPSEIQE
ncbi:hypothetical protein ABIE21_001140 [Conyzicola nivalis]|uniref:Uncharacterized protein n=1 Tax=Conyzicola nivalis TaxID=1477021 RepID=A0ABV2QKY9_9MICO